MLILEQYVLDEIDRRRHAFDFSINLLLIPSVIDIKYREAISFSCSKKNKERTNLGSFKDTFNRGKCKKKKAEPSRGAVEYKQKKALLSLCFR